MRQNLPPKDIATIESRIQSRNWFAWDNLLSVDSGKLNIGHAINIMYGEITNHDVYSIQIILFVDITIKVYWDHETFSTKFAYFVHCRWHWNFLPTLLE